VQAQVPVLDASPPSPIDARAPDRLRSSTPALNQSTRLRERVVDGLGVDLSRSRASAARSIQVRSNKCRLASNFA
jgi:hypothetical protein